MHRPKGILISCEITGHKDYRSKRATQGLMRCGNSAPGCAKILESFASHVGSGGGGKVVFFFFFFSLSSETLALTSLLRVCATCTGGPLQISRLVRDEIIRRMEDRTIQSELDTNLVLFLQRNSQISKTHILVLIQFADGLQLDRRSRPRRRDVVKRASNDYVIFSANNCCRIFDTDGAIWSFARALS